MLDRILVKRLRPAAQTASGILLPESSLKNQMNRGVVLAVGPGTSEYKMSLREGDHVILPQFGAQEVNVEGLSNGPEDGEPVLLMRESDVLAKMLAHE